MAAESKPQMLAPQGAQDTVNLGNSQHCEARFWAVPWRW